MYTPVRIAISVLVVTAPTIRKQFTTLVVVRGVVARVTLLTGRSTAMADVPGVASVTANKQVVTKGLSATEWRQLTAKSSIPKREHLCWARPPKGGLIFLS